MDRLNIPSGYKRLHRMVEKYNLKLDRKNAKNNGIFFSNMKCHDFLKGKKKSNEQHNS